MDRLQTLEMFVAVAGEGGFAAAARKLGSSPPAVTRGIAALEARLGTALFHRSTRAVALTDAGTAFLGEARRLLGELADAERAVRGAQAEPRGQLYLTAPVMFGRLHVLPVVDALLTEYDALAVRMMLIDRNVRIVEEGIDVAVRIGPLATTSLKAVRVGAVRQMLVASPAYLARRGAPAAVADLAGHDIVGMEGPRTTNEWQLASVRWRFDRRPRLSVNTVDAAMAAAEAGRGIANLLSYQVARASDAGRLVALLPNEAPPALPVHLLFEPSRAALPSVRLFIEAMKARMRMAGLG